MTIPELVQRVKHLDTATSTKQVEKFVTELLGPNKRSDFLMLRLYKRQTLAKLKKLKDE